MDGAENPSAARHAPAISIFFYQAFQQGLGLTCTLLGNVGQIYSPQPLLKGLFQFLDPKPLIANAAAPAAALRTLSQVSASEM